MADDQNLVHVTSQRLGDAVEVLGRRTPQVDGVPGLGADDELKFVCADRRDYEWSRGVLAERGLPVLCLFRPSAGRRLSAMIAGDPAVVCRFYEDPAEAAEHLAEFFA